MTQEYGRLAPGRGVFPLFPLTGETPPTPPAPVPAPQQPSTPAPAPARQRQRPVARPSYNNLPQANPQQQYGFQYDPKKGWNSDFMTVYNQIRSGVLPKDAMRFTNPSNTYEADLNDYILYGTPMPYEDGGEIMAGADSKVGGGVEQVISEPAKIVGIKSGKVYATVSENGPELIKIIPADQAGMDVGMPPEGSQMGASGPPMPMMGGMPPMSPEGAPPPAMPGMDAPGYVTGGELLAMGYDPNDPAVQQAIRSGSLNFSTPVPNVSQAVPNAQMQAYNPVNSQPLYQESQQHNIAPSPLVPIAKAAERNFAPTQPAQQYPQVSSSMNTQGQTSSMATAVGTNADYVGGPTPNFQGRGGITQPQPGAQGLTQSFNNLITNTPRMTPQDSQDFNILYQSLQNQVMQGQATEAEAVQAFQQILNTSPYRGMDATPATPAAQPQGAILGNSAVYNSTHEATAVPPPIQPLPSQGATIGAPAPAARPIGPVSIPDVVHGGYATLQPQVVEAIQMAFPPNEWTTAQYIIAAESKGNTGAVGGAGEVGLFQIHPTNWAGLTRLLGEPINAQTLQDPYVNARAAAEIWKGAQGWGRVGGNPWATAPGVFQFFQGR